MVDLRVRFFLDMWAFLDIAEWNVLFIGSYKEKYGIFLVTAQFMELETTFQTLFSILKYP